jgi:hypothetical protein
MPDCRLLFLAKEKLFVNHFERLYETYWKVVDIVCVLNSR